MRTPDSEEPRVETLAAALIYLMTHYLRSGSPQLAVAVRGHIECLAAHRDAPPVLRDICAGLEGYWCDVASGQRRPLH